jgi:antitoxin ParD1/3/4
VPTRNINLTDHFDSFVANQIEAGRYHNASEVLRAGLRLLEQQTDEEQQKLKLPKSLAGETFEQLDQGEGIELHQPRQLSRLVGRIGRRTAASKKRRSRGV